jgi:DnaJ-domain-containing protein 1
MESMQSSISFPRFGATEKVTIEIHNSNVKKAVRSTTESDASHNNNNNNNIGTSSINASSYTAFQRNNNPEYNGKSTDERCDNNMNRNEVLSSNRKSNTDSNTQFEQKLGNKVGRENDKESNEKYPDSKVHSSSSSHNVREYIVLDDSDDGDEDEEDLNTSSKSETLPERTVIEIDDDSDSSDDEDDIVFVGVHNQTKINLEQKLKAASEERERNLLNTRLRQDESFEKAKATLRCCQTNYNADFMKKTNVPIAQVGGGNRKRHAKSMSKKPHRKPRGRDFFDDYRLSAMEEQERLFREAANRVRSSEENRRRQELAQKKATNNNDNYSHIVSTIVHDVTTLPSLHWKWKDPWSRLGVPPDTSFDIVKRNYRKLLLLYHPDKNNNRDDATNRFLAIKEAYETIMTKI